MTSNEDLQLAVKHGAYWLDENHPGWANKINLSRFHMDMCDQCVIGQAVGEFHKTVQNAGGYEWATECGFDLTLPWDTDPNIIRSTWDKLEALWADQVMERINVSGTK